MRHIAILAAPPEHRSKTSAVVLSLAQQCLEDRVTLSSLTDRLGDRTFGILLIVVSALSFVPIVSMLSGVLVSWLGLQMAVGRRKPYLPRKLLDLELHAEGTHLALKNFGARIVWLEKYVRPRWHFSEAPIVDCMNGVLVATLGVVIAVPIPFTNIPPALVVVTMAVGLLERDGIVQLIAFVTGVVAIGLLLILI